MRRLSGAVLILIGTAAFTACLLSVATGMRDVMRVGAAVRYDSFSPAGLNGSFTDAVPQPKLMPLVNLGIWLGTSAVGAVIGLLLSSPLINAMK